MTGDPLTLTATLGAVLTALGCYHKGFRDGGYLVASLKIEVARLSRKLELIEVGYEARLDLAAQEHYENIAALKQELANLREANAVLTTEMIALKGRK